MEGPPPFASRHLRLAATQREPQPTAGAPPEPWLPGERTSFLEPCVEGRVRCPRCFRQPPNAPEAWPAVCPDTGRFVPAGLPMLGGGTGPPLCPEARPGLPLGSGRRPPRCRRASPGSAALPSQREDKTQGASSAMTGTETPLGGGPVTATRLLDVKPPSAQHRAAGVSWAANDRASSLLWNSNAGARSPEAGARTHLFTQP